MNYAGPFDAGLTHDSPVSLGGERFSFDSKPGFVQHHESDSHVLVPDAHLLFSGEYMRIGSDLIISGDGQKLVIGNYFKGETRPALTTKDGATLSGHIVDALTGHVHYAQAAAPAAGEVIGHVLKLSGSATVIRNGVSIELHIGDAVQKGDVVQTGSDSTIGLTFIDGSAFGMTSNARMVLNEMIYDPNGSSNSSLISLVQGTITFVAGQTAKNGNMRVETPVATMGIRGTAVLVEIGANDGPTKFSVLVEPDGHTGSYNLYDKTSGQLIGTVSQAGQVTFVSVSGIGQPPTAIEQLKTLADQQAEKALIQQVFQLYFPNYNPDDSNPKKFGSNTSGNNLAEVTFTTTTNNQQTYLTQVELRFAVTDPLTGITTYQSKIFYNTKAQFWVDSINAEQAFVESVETFKISDLVHIDDPDIANGPFYDVAVPFVPGSAIIKSAVSTNPNLDANFLSRFLCIDQTTGVISFDRLGFNFLGQDESVTFMVQVTARSGPDVAKLIIPITITGRNDIPNDDGVPNDAPTIVLHLSDIIGAVKEDTPVGAPSLAENGTITFRDVDLTDTHTAAVAFTSSSSDLPDFATSAHLGTFTIDPVLENTTDKDNPNLGSVGWHFSLPDPDNNSTLQSLAEGQTITQVYTITITDIHDAEVTQTVTITITGTNDAPVLTTDASVHQTVEVPNTTGSTTEDVATGSLTFVDLDLSDTHQASAALHPGSTSVVWSGGDYNDIPQATRDALDGAMTTAVSEINTDTNNQGSVSWEFKLPDHLFDFLAHGETLTLIYDVKVADYNNGVGMGTYSTQQVTVQISAANDQPVITVIDNSAAVQEDADVATGNLLKDTGSVTFTDTDLTDAHTAHVAYTTAVASSGATVQAGLATALATALTIPSPALAAGEHSFDWNFALDNGLVQYLADGETITATYTITVADNSGSTTDNTSPPQVVTVTITGTNDVPVIAVTDPAAVAEGDAGTPVSQTVTVANHVAISDADASDLHTPYVANTLTFDASSGPAPLNGVLESLFTLNATDGTISYDRAAFDYLADGEHVTATFTFDASSGPDTVPKSITVTIDGVNDAPIAHDDVITIDGTSNLFAIASNLTGNDTDPDTSDTPVISGGKHGITSGIPDGDGIIRIAGTFGTLLLFSLSHPADTTLGSLTVPGAMAGDYVFVVGFDADGNPITNNPINALTPGDAPLTDQFQYTIADGHGLFSTANIDITYDLSPITIMVQAANGFDATSLWTKLHGGDVTSNSATQITLTYGAHVITVEGNDLTSTQGPGPGDLELTGGTISAIHVADTSGALIDLNNINVQATDFYNAVGPSGTQTAFDDLLKPHAFDFEGGAGPDIFVGGDFNDRIEGGAGNDTFVFKAGFGQDTVTDFQAGGHDIIQFDASLFASLQDILDHTADSSGNAVITASAYDTVTLHGVTKAQLQQTDFHIA